MEFRVLGPVEIRVGGEQIAAGPPRQRAVLAALVVDAGRLVPVDVLVERVWGENAPDRAPRTLHTYIARQQRYVDVVVSWACAELGAGNADAVCAPLRELADDHALVEPLALVMMQSLGAAGRSAEALQYYAAFRRRLADELGVDPGPELQAAHRALLRGTQALPADRAVSGSAAVAPPAETRRPADRAAAPTGGPETRGPAGLVAAGRGGSARLRWSGIPAVRTMLVLALAVLSALAARAVSEADRLSGPANIGVALADVLGMLAVVAVLAPSRAVGPGTPSSAMPRCPPSVRAKAGPDPTPS